MDIHTLKECISEADDPRRTSHGHVLHRFEDIIIIGLCTVISGGEDFADTFRRVFEAVDPAELGAGLSVELSDTRRRGSAISGRNTS